MTTLTISGKQITDAVAGSLNLPKKDVEAVASLIQSRISDELAAGREVRFTGFGTYSVGRRKASEGRNPRTGEKIQIAAKRVAGFKAGKRLRDRLNPAH